MTPAIMALVQNVTEGKTSNELTVIHFIVFNFNHCTPVTSL